MLVEKKNGYVGRIKGEEGEGGKGKRRRWREGFEIDREARKIILLRKLFGQAWGIYLFTKF